MPQFRIEISDPETGDLVHINSHTLFGYNWYDALLRFATEYGFRLGSWKLRAQEVDERGYPVKRYR